MGTCIAGMAGLLVGLAIETTLDFLFEQFEQICRAKFARQRVDYICSIGHLNETHVWEVSKFKLQLSLVWLPPPHPHLHDVIIL